jgi:hypothetical protein
MHCSAWSSFHVNRLQQAMMCCGQPDEILSWGERGGLMRPDRQEKQDADVGEAMIFAWNWPMASEGHSYGWRATKSGWWTSYFSAPSAEAVGNEFLKNIFKFRYNWPFDKAGGGLYRAANNFFSCWQRFKRGKKCLGYKLMNLQSPHKF